MYLIYMAFNLRITFFSSNVQWHIKQGSGICHSHNVVQDTFQFIMMSIILSKFLSLIRFAQHIPLYKWRQNSDAASEKAVSSEYSYFSVNSFGHVCLFGEIDQAVQTSRLQLFLCEPKVSFSKSTIFIESDYVHVFHSI